MKILQKKSRENIVYKLPELILFFVFILQETNEPLVVERERTLSGGSSNSSSGSSSQPASSGGSSWEKVDTNDA